MPTRSIDVKITFDDEEYRQKLSRLKGLTALYKSELEATTAAFKGQEDSVAALSARNEVLSKLLETSRHQVDLETAAINTQKQNIEECKKQYDEWSNVLSSSKERLSVLTLQQQAASNGIVSLREEYRTAAQRLKEAQDRVKALNEQYTGTTRNFPWFKQRMADANAEVERAKEKFNDARTSLTNMRKAYGDTTNEIYATNAAIEEAENEMTAWSKKEADVEGFLRRHQTAQNKATAEVTKYNHELQENKKNIDACKEAHVDSVQALEKHNKELEKSAELAQAAATKFLADALKKYAKEIEECVQEYMKLETAMIGVSKTMNDDGMSRAEVEEWLHNLQEDFKALSTMLPVSAAELAKIAELGGQLGVSNDGLEKFATTIANISVSTNLDIEEASTAMAQFANIVGVTESEYERLGSSVVALGNNFATDEKTIMLMAQRFAAAGVAADMSADKIVAMAAAAGSLGFRADAGASSMTKLIETVKEAVSTGENLDDFAALAGMTGKEFKRAFEEDAAGAIAKFLGGLGETGTSMTQISAELGFAETRVGRLVTSLAAAEANNGLLTRSLQESNDAWAKNIALQTEADKFNASTANSLKMLQNGVDNLKASIGEQLAPAANGVIGIARFGIDAVNALAEAFPFLIKVVGAASAVFAAFAIKALPDAVASVGVLKANIINVCTGAFAQMQSSIANTIISLYQMSAASIATFGAIGVVIVGATIAMRAAKKEADALRDSERERYAEEFDGIKTAGEARRRYNEIEAERQAIIDRLIAKGRQATAEEQVQIDSRTEAMEKLQSLITNLREQYRSDAEKRLATLHDEVSAYDELSAAIYDNAAAEDYLMDKKNTNYELTYDQIKTNLESQQQWAKEYSENFDYLISQDIEGIEEWALSWADGSDEAAEKLNALKGKTKDEIQLIMEMEQTSKDMFHSLGEAPAELQRKIDSQNVFQSLIEDAEYTVNEVRERLMALNGLTITPHFNASNMTIGGYAQGLSYVPYDEYPALLHEGEMVLSRAEARMYRNMEMANRTVGDNVNNNIVLNVYGGNNQSPSEIANIVMDKLQKATERKSAVWA